MTPVIYLFVPATPTGRIAKAFAADEKAVIFDLERCGSMVVTGFLKKTTHLVGFFCIGGRTACWSTRTTADRHPKSHDFAARERAMATGNSRCRAVTKTVDAKDGNGSDRDNRQRRILMLRIAAIQATKIAVSTRRSLRIALVTSPDRPYSHRI